MSDDHGRSRRRRPPGGSRRRVEFDDESFDDADDRDTDDDRRPARGRATRPKGRGGAAPKKRGVLGGLFGSRKSKAHPSRGKRGERFDWGAADDDGDVDGSHRYAEYTERDDEAAEDEAPRRARRTSKQPPSRKKLTLMDLCTPVFGFAAVLPRSPEDPQPTYDQFREQVLAALQRVENEASEHDIELEDASSAAYALSFFMDSHVANSKWSAKDQWASEPLGIVLQQDAEGGINFFKRLESLGDRHKAVKEVFLVCLALGFRGKYAELEATQQATKIGEIRQKLVRSINPVPLEKQGELFPEGYTPAEPIEDEVPPPPRWWLFASLGAVVFAALIWGLLFWGAGRISVPHKEAIDQLIRVGETSTNAAAAPPPAAPDGDEEVQQ